MTMNIVVSCGFFFLQCFEKKLSLTSLDSSKYVQTTWYHTLSDSSLNNMKPYLLDTN